MSDQHAGKQENHILHRFDHKNVLIKTINNIKNKNMITVNINTNNNNSNNNNN